MPKWNTIRREILFKIICCGPSGGKEASQYVEAVYRQISLQQGLSTIDFTPIDARHLELEPTFGIYPKFSLCLALNQYYKILPSLVFRDVDGILFFIGDDQEERLETYLEALLQIEEHLRSHYLDIYEFPLILCQTGLSHPTKPENISFPKCSFAFSQVDSTESFVVLKKCASQILERFWTQNESLITLKKNTIPQNPQTARLLPKPPSPFLHPTNYPQIPPGIPRYSTQTQPTYTYFSFQHPPKDYVYPTLVQTGKEKNEIKERIRIGSTAREMWRIVKRSPHFLSALEELQKKQSEENRFYRDLRIREEFLLHLALGNEVPTPLSIFETLRTHLSQPDEKIQRRVIWALGELGEKAQKALPDLKLLFHHSNPFISKGSLKAFKKIAKSTHFS